jgi:glucose-1-phosphate cytidylyltransferase
MKKNDTWAVILCGGFGSRMGDLTKDVPKPLIQVHDRPILWYILMTLRKYGIKNLVFPLGYKGDMLQDYITSNFGNSDFNIHCVDTGVETTIAHRIAKISHVIPENADFLLLNSDTIFDFDLEAMLKLHQSSNALVTLASVEIVSAWGLIHIRKDDTLSGFSRERKARYLMSNDDPDQRGYIYSGIGYLNKNAFKHVDLQTCRDFEQDLFTNVIKAGRAAHYEIEGSWFAIDTQKDFQIINQLTGDSNNRGQKAHQIKEKLSENS